MYIIIENLIIKNWLISFLQNLDIDIIQLLKLELCDLFIDIQKYKNCIKKVYRLIDIAQHDLDNDDKSFHFLLDDDVYEKSEGDGFEHYESVIGFKNNFKSPIHYFPQYIFDQFEENVNILYKDIIIYHCIDIFILENKLKMKYNIHNTFEFVSCDQIINIDIKLNTQTIIDIITMIVYNYDNNKLLPTDCDGFVYDV